MMMILIIRTYLNHNFVGVFLRGFFYTSFACVIVYVTVNIWCDYLCFYHYSASVGSSVMTWMSVSLSLCVCLCMYVCLQAYLQNYTFCLHQIFIHVT